MSARIRKEKLKFAGWWFVTSVRRHCRLLIIVFRYLSSAFIQQTRQEATSGHLQPYFIFELFEIRRMDETNRE